MKTQSPLDWEVLPLGEVVKPSRPRINPAEKPDLPFVGMEHIEAHTMKLLGTVPAGTMIRLFTSSQEMFSMVVCVPI